MNIFGVNLGQMNPVINKKFEDFFRQYKNQKYKKGEILVRADDEPSGVFCLIEGVVRRYSISPDGEDLTINIYRPVSFFPMSWVINDFQSSHYFEAMTDVEIYRAPKEATLKFIKENEDVMLGLLSRVYFGLEGYVMRMEYLMHGNAQSRLISDLLVYVKDFGKQQGNKILLDLKVTEKDLASLSGLTRETVSREIKKLKNSGLIDFQKNHIIINDLKSLEHQLFGV